MYFLIHFVFPQQKGFCASKITSLSLHTSSPERYSHTLLPISTVRFPKQFKTVKTPPLVYSFNVFFQKIPPSLSNQLGQLHLTLTLCFAFSHLSLCFIFYFFLKASLSAAWWQQNRCYRIMFHFYLCSQAKFNVQGHGLNYFLMAFGYLLNTHSSVVWCLFSDVILLSIIATI